MALPVLDGNQSATTLSSVVTGGEHIVAHTVVSLGSTAISNITSAVSGSVVSVSNFPSTQTIAGTVTANVFGYDWQNEENLRIGLISYGTDPENTRGAVEIIGANGNPLPISGTVTVGNTVTIAGTVTANPTGIQTIAGTVTATVRDGQDAIFYDGPSGNTAIRAASHWYSTDDNELRTTSQADPLPISGTVTVGNSVTVAGTVTANVGILQVPSIAQGTSVVGEHEATPKPNYGIQIGYYHEHGGVFVNVEDTDNADYELPIKGGRGNLTTRFGSVTTANTAFATSAVTNSTRHYLLIQNVTTGSNVITVGIGFTPTTTQGIQLAVGAGITFESSYIPTGAVYVLSSVTASNFTVLEA